MPPALDPEAPSGGFRRERLEVFLVCPYAVGHPGGVQAQVTGLATRLRSSGARVTVFAPGRLDRPGFRSLGRPVSFSDNGSIVRTSLSPRELAKMARRIRRAGPAAIVHLHEPMLPACMTALAASRGPVVATFHRASHDLRWYRRFGPLVRRAGGRIDGRIAVSESARDAVAGVLPGSYRIIPNAIDAAAFGARAAPPASAAGEPLRVLFVGRPEPRKGLQTLLRAVAQMQRPVRLDLAGPPVLDRYPPGVHGHGTVGAGVLHRLLAAADVLCAPSTGGESFGLVLAEAMAAGAAVVASDLPGYAAVLPEDCGLLVPPGDAPAFARALDGLAADRPRIRRMGEAGRAHARRYDWSRVLPEILAAYRDAAGRRPPVTT